MAGLQNFIIKLFGGNAFLATFFISMIPLIELKGAIPFGMSQELFSGHALSPISALIAASTGAFVPAIFIVWLFPRLLSWLKKRKTLKSLSQRLENIYKSKAGKISEKGKRIKDYLLLILFVAAPLPLTGAYTGAIVASVMGFSYFSSLVCILVGNLVCGGIVVLLCTLLSGYELYVLLGFGLLLAFILVARVVKKLLKKFKKAS